MTSQPLARQESPARLGSDTARRRFIHRDSNGIMQKIWTAGNKASSTVCEEEGLPGVGGHAVRGDGRPSGSRHRIPVTRQGFLKETPSTEGFPVYRHSAASSIITETTFPPEHFTVKAEGWVSLLDPYCISHFRTPVFCLLLIETVNGKYVVPRLKSRESLLTGK